VHSFASDPDRGVFILGILVIATGGSLALYAWRAPQLQSRGLFQPISREGGLVLNNLLLTTAAATVFLGTLYPLFLDAFGGEKVSVGPPFFNATFVPLMIPLVIAVGIGPLLPWKRADLGGVMARLKMAFVVAALVALGTAYLTWGKTVFGPIGIGIAGWLCASVLLEMGERIGLGRIAFGDSLERAAGLPRAAWGMTIAHFGLAITVAGVTGAALWQVESIQIMKPGQTVDVSGYEFTFDDARQIRGPNYAAERGFFTVKTGGKELIKLEPERRRYLVSGQETTEAAIFTTAMYDLYVVLGEGNGKGGWTIRLYYKPLVPWLWIGSLIMVLGGIVSLTDRRLRIGAPSRRQQDAAVSPAPAE
jgi:cytochrome c-type biogenesis protein CcmF